MLGNEPENYIHPNNLRADIKIREVLARGPQNSGSWLGVDFLSRKDLYGIHWLLLLYLRCYP